MRKKKIKIEVPTIFGDFNRPYRYRIWYGGRGSGKSWNIARTLIALAVTKPLRILCCREYHNSIGDSIQKLIIDQIHALGLEPWFKITQNTISSTVGSEFIFRGLGINSYSIKSIEKIDIAWVEEAQTISQLSLDILIPTIRSPSSEIWFTYNPYLESDPIHRFMLSLQNRSNAFIQKVGWQDNPWFPKVLHDERQRLLQHDPILYQHIWEGECRIIHDAIIFKDCFSIEKFTAPPQTHFYFGVDWGFAKDPTILIRCFIDNHSLYIDYENGGVGIDLDLLPKMFDHIPEVRKWTIRADNARPETISYLRKKGFKIIPALKTSGSIEEGISRIRNFNKIIIHPRCTRTIKEFNLYSYKIDPKSGDILPLIQDSHNHSIDALRYALEPIIHPKPQLPNFSNYPNK